MAKNQDPAGKHSYAYPIHPSAVATSTPLKNPDEVIFNATQGANAFEWTFDDLSDIDGIATWTWDFGDGEAPDVRTDPDPFVYTYAQSGVYVVSLLLTLSNGNTAGPATAVIRITTCVAITDSASLALTDSASLAITGKPQ